MVGIDSLIASLRRFIRCSPKEDHMAQKGLAVWLGVGAVLLVIAPAYAKTAPIAPPTLTCASSEPTLVGTSRADRLVGTPGADVIVALGGRDVVRGRGGDDLICGGRGADLIHGGRGDDRLYGQLSGIGSDGETDRFYRGDRLDGGSGDDLLDVGAASVDHDYRSPEVLDFSSLDSAVTVDLATRTAVTRTGDRDTLVHIGGIYHRRAVLGTRFADVLMGTDDDDILAGRGGDDAIQAREGGDTLRGGRGEDNLVGGRYHDSTRDIYEPQIYGDRLVPGPGDDRVVPVAGNEFAENTDTLIYSRSRQSVFVSLFDGRAAGQGRDRLVIDGALTVVGSQHRDQLMGDRFRQVLVGLSGRDLVAGRGEVDSLVGDGDYRYRARQPGNDYLVGGAADDYLDGGPLADVLIGGVGRDSEFDDSNDNLCRRIERVQRRGC